VNRIHNQTIDDIIENLFYVLPIIHKKLLKIDPSGLPAGLNLSRLQIGIMGITKEEVLLPISEIARRLGIPKPQMTLLIEHLVKDGMVERRPNENDRRVSDIALTEKGQTTLHLCEEHLKKNMRDKLSFLGEKDLRDLSTALGKLKDIGSRWETRKREKNGNN
jgi:DNA-binding MarR family transcriptional regulator